jgi:mutator protein MutT
MLVRAGRVFLVHRSPLKAKYPSVWDFPGGHLEPGENGRQALVRELREELGVEITPPDGSAILTRQDAELVQEVWLVEQWDGEILNAAPDEHDAIGWFTLDETMALDLAAADYPALFKRLLA